MITIDEIIKRDLYRDYRTYTDHDDSDWPTTFEPPVECSDANISVMMHYFGMIRSDCKSILEIGVGNNNEHSFTKLLLDNKLTSTKYFGIDIKDKSEINDDKNNVFTLQADSSNIEEIISFAKSHGVEAFDFIFIDSWASINQVLNDWRYVDFLSDDGIIAFHDTNFHPGPTELVNNLKVDRYEVYKKCEQNTDWGITFVNKIKNKGN
jgi:predicted O-methyltransferase YrrM